MKSKGFINKVKIYSVVAFLLPLITINSCLLLYKFFGDIDTYPNVLNWDEKKIETPSADYNENNRSYVNCPKHTYNEFLIIEDNEILLIADDKGFNFHQEKDQDLYPHIFEQGEIVNYRCIKNHKYLNLILSNFNLLEKILIKGSKNNTSGFSSIKNPYLYGEVSISRTARYFPATFIFKPFIILSAFFLFLYWRNNLNIFNELSKNNSLNKFSKNFFYLGLLSCVFLALHASLLGLEYDSKLFSKARKLIIILFILFEISAQVSLTRNLYKLRIELKEHIRLFMIRVKIAFVIMTIFGTVVVLSFLVWGNISSEVKHIFEWNYFSILLIYYFLSRMLWKP